MQVLPPLTKVPLDRARGDDALNNRVRAVSDDVVVHVLEHLQGGRVLGIVLGEQPLPIVDRADAIDACNCVVGPALRIALLVVDGVGVLVLRGALRLLGGVRHSHVRALLPPSGLRGL